MSNTTYEGNDKLLHSGRKGMKWGQHIFGRSRASAFSSRRRRRHEGGLDEREREIALLNLYRNRDRVSTKVLKEKVNRIETEQKLKKLAEAPAIARAEAKKKRQQARLQFAAKAASAALDVYSKWPNQSVAKKFDPAKQGKELKKALEDFEYRKGMAKAFKDIPLTLTKFDGNVNVDTSKLFQSVNVAGVDVYIPRDKEVLLQYGKRGMKWRKKKIGAMPDLDDVLYNLDKKHIDEHVEEAKRDVASANKNAEVARDRIKRAAAEGKKPSQQDIDAYNRYSKSKADSAKILELRRKHAKEVRDNHLKEKAAKVKGKSSMKHSATGGELNGVYIPSNEEVLLQYGRKGMKWRKKQGIANDAPFTDEEKRDDANDAKVIEAIDRRRKETRAEHLKTLEGIYGKGKVTRAQLDAFQDKVFKADRAMIELRRKHRSMNANHASRNALYDKLRRGKGAVKA
nr:MAG TPA: Structural protein [Caudoviricetes sp.]